MGHMALPDPIAGLWGGAPEGREGGERKGWEGREGETKGGEKREGGGNYLSSFCGSKKLTT